MVANASRALSASFNVLIVEDLKLHAIILQRIVKMATGKWYHTSSDWASSEIKALDFCAKKTYDLIIADYHMNPKLGSKITRSLLEKYPDFYVIGYSACEDPEIKNDCLRSGMKDLLPKESQKMKQFLTSFAEHSLVKNSQG